MIAEPQVVECILAGPNPPAAVARFRLRVRVVSKTHDICIGDRRHVLGAIRIAPPLKVPERFRAYANWWPVKGE